MDDKQLVFPGNEFWTRERFGKFCELATLTEFDKGDVIMLPVKPEKVIFLIESGTVNMSYFSDKGKAVTVLQNGPGEILGLKGAFRETSRMFYAIADTKARAWRLSHEKFDYLLKNDFDFVRYVINRFVTQMDAIEHKMLKLVFISAYTKVAMALYDMALHSEVKGNEWIEVKTTQQQLGNIMNVSRQTTNECLRRMEQEGIIRIRRGGIDVIKLNMLEKLATGEE